MKRLLAIALLSVASHAHAAPIDLGPTKPPGDGWLHVVFVDTPDHDGGPYRLFEPDGEPQRYVPLVGNAFWLRYSQRKYFDLMDDAFGADRGAKHYLPDGLGDELIVGVGPLRPSTAGEQDQRFSYNGGPEFWLHLDRAPEPATWTLAGFALLGLVARRGGHSLES